MFPRRVTGFGVHNHSDRVNGSRLQFANRKRIAADQLLSGKFDPSSTTTVGRVLIRERVYAAHLRRPRVERERDTGRVHRQHGVLVRFFGHWKYIYFNLITMDQ